MKTNPKIQKRILVSGLLIFLMITSFLVVVPVLADDDDEDENETNPPVDDEEETEEVEDKDDDDDGIEEEEEEANERELQIEVSSYSVQIESEQEIDGKENEFKIEIEIPGSNAEEEEVEFELEFSSDTSTEEIELEFKVSISEIVEYIDVNSDGIYNKTEDQIVQTYLFDEFHPIAYTTENISGNIVHVINIESLDGVFTSQIYASGEFALVNGSLITPVELKIDIGIHNFPYQEPNSALAMKVKMESEGEIEIDEETEDEQKGYSTNEQEVEISTGDFTGFFSWIETALVDGVEKQVKVTQLEVEEGEQKLYLNYPRGNEIIHDPKIGIANLLQDVSSNPFGIDGFLLFTAISALTLFGLLTMVRKRTKKKL